MSQRKNVWLIYTSVGDSDCDNYNDLKYVDTNVKQS